MLRPELPNLGLPFASAVARSEVVKQLVSNQLETVFWPAPLQILSGRAFELPLLEKSCGDRTLRGKPLWKARTPVISQPPRMPLMTRPWFKYRFPAPTGNRQM